MLPQRLPRCGYAVDISYGEISVPQQEMWENQRKTAGNIVGVVAYP
jgi:hypothetical protein